MARNINNHKGKNLKIAASTYPLQLHTEFDMNTVLPTKEEILALADASNELCAAIEILKINNQNALSDTTMKMLFQRKDVVWEILEKFGY